MLRSRRRIYSLAFAILGIVGFYWLFRDVELALVSKSIIREKSIDANTMAQISEMHIEGDEIAVPMGQSSGKIKENLKLKDSIMPSMPDLESKKALGNASWKYFHTLLARFPEAPTKEEREKLKSFIHLYAELYPCGECSYHFVKMIKNFPVQTSSRKVAALWGCDIHNKVNAFLKKDIYDCSNILEDYDCGCGDDPEILE